MNYTRLSCDWFNMLFSPVVIDHSDIFGFTNLWKPHTHFSTATAVGRRKKTRFILFYFFLRFVSEATAVGRREKRRVSVGGEIIFIIKNTKAPGVSCIKHLKIGGRCLQPLSPSQKILFSWAPYWSTRLRAVYWGQGTQQDREKILQKAGNDCRKPPFIWRCFMQPGPGPNQTVGVVALESHVQHWFYIKLAIMSGTGKLGKRKSECSYQESNLRPSDN